MPAITLSGNPTGATCIICKEPILTGQSYESNVTKGESFHVGCKGNKPKKDELTNNSISIWLF